MPRRWQVLRVLEGAAMLSLASCFLTHTRTNTCRTYGAMRGNWIRASMAEYAVNLVNGRVSSEGKSLDVNLIASHPELVLSHLRARRASEEQLQNVYRISELAARRKELLQVGDAARNVRKTVSTEIGKLMRVKDNNDAIEALKAQVAAAVQEAEKADVELVGVDSEMYDLYLRIPNLLDDRVPDGDDSNQNVCVFEWGTDKRLIGDHYKWHDEIAERLSALDNDAAVRMSGSRFSVLIGPLAKLERALTQFFLDFHTSRGYTEVSVPFIVSRSTLQGTGQLPKFEEDLFKVNHKVGQNEDAFLIPTAEVPLTSLYRDQVLNHTEIPMHLCAHTPCFRAEAGSYGRDTRGLLRQHQFHKVELVKITAPDVSIREHEAMVDDAEALLQALGLPYRRMLLCSGDVGFGARLCYDLEVWLPGQQMYREISSISTCHDFQSKRMQLRYRPAPTSEETQDKKKKKVSNPHTMNGSGLAVGRTLVAILETFQREDGSVGIPEVLQPYMGGMAVLEPLPEGTTTRFMHHMHRHENLSGLV